MKRFEHFIRFQLPAIAWAVLIFLLSSIPAGKLPILAHYLNDKVEHAAEYFVFGLLIYRALEPAKNRNRFSWFRLVIPILVIIVFGLSDEYHQGFVPGRSVDMKDVMADTVGGLFAAIAIYIFERRRQTRPDEA
jgi:VanZ family protein